MIKYRTKSNKHQNAYDVELLNIPEHTYNYAENSSCNDIAND